MIIFLYGIMMAGTMIMAIGAQNAHVIRCGFSGNNVFFASLTCFLCDFFLMSFGVFFIGSLSSISKSFNIIICILSLGFLVFYGLNSFKNAFQASTNNEFEYNYHFKKEPIYRTVLSTLAVTLFNPHVYLDTVVVVGGYASSLTLDNKYYFISGALLASFCWFFSLGYLSQHLKKFFNNRKMWIFFDLFVGFFMLIIGLNIVFYLYKLLQS